MLARGIQSILRDLKDAMTWDDDYEGEHRAFDCLTTEQKIWTMPRIAYGLLDRKTPVCRHTAFLEAAIACVFRQLESEVNAEICYAAEFADELGADDDRDTHLLSSRFCSIPAYKSKSQSRRGLCIDVAQIVPPKRRFSLGAEGVIHPLLGFQVRLERLPRRHRRFGVIVPLRSGRVELLQFL